MNPQQISDSTGSTFDRAVEWLAPLSDAMHEFGINTPRRQAAFLSQVGHESGGLVYTKEIWGPTAAQAKYEGRADLGNVNLGDGSKYRGRGLIQITGRANYAQAGAALRVDIVDNPDLLEQPALAARASAWWWRAHGCNELSDHHEYLSLTRRINGGTNGLADRLARWEKAKVAFGDIA